MKTSLLALSLSALVATATMPALAQSDAIETERHDVQLHTITDGLENPWGMTFISNTEVLVTERPGHLRRVSLDGTVSEPLSGVPKVDARNQGGLLDVAVDPDFAENNYIYISYAELNPDNDKENSTAVARGKLDGNSLTDVEVIFQQYPKYESTGHFGSRLVFSPEGHLYITLGDRQTRMDASQELDTHIGKTVRIWPDGSVPEDNPFVNQDGALPEIWSYGNRNVQGAALHPETKELWASEHGPRGGDEINIIRAGNNYGWPDASYGINYDGSILTEHTHLEGAEQPHYYWVPSIATAGIMFYTGDKFPEWKGDLFVGALRDRHVARLDLEGERVMHEETLLKGDIEQRVRAIAQGPDGYIYLLTDDPDGRLVQVKPAND